MVITQNKTKIVVSNNSNICDALRDLVPFVQFKKREKKTMEECYF